MCLAMTCSPAVSTPQMLFPHGHYHTVKLSLWTLLVHGPYYFLFVVLALEDNYFLVLEGPMWLNDTSIPGLRAVDPIECSAYCSTPSFHQDSSVLYNWMEFCTVWLDLFNHSFTALLCLNRMG